MKIYTEHLLKQDTLNLRNHISYWLLITLLVESGLITDIDEEYINEAEESSPEEPFFLFEKSLELLTKFLYKLAQWPCETIYIFYLYILNLYYSYEGEKTYEAIMKAFENKPNNQKLFTIDYVFAFENV